MYPYAMTEIARDRHSQLIRQAERNRLAQAARLRGSSGESLIGRLAGRLSRRPVRPSTEPGLAGI